MPFDAEGYRQAAKEAGISDDVIKRTIAEQSAGVKDVATKPTQQDVSVEMFPNLVKQVMEYAPEAIGAYLGFKALTSDTAKSVGKSIKDRMIGAPKEPVRIEPTMEGPKEPTFSPPSKVGPVSNMPGTPEEMQKVLGPNWKAIWDKSEAIRKEKQAIAQTKIDSQMGLVPPSAPAAQPPVVGGQPPAPPAPAGAVPPQNRIPSMMAAQEMSNPLGGLASAYTEPLRPPPTVAEMGQQSGGVISEAAKAPAATIPPEPQKEGKKRGTSTKEERAAKQESYNKLAAEAPEGFRPQYTKKKGEMGPGAYNWLYGQEGEKAPQVWKALFGEKNIPYSHEPSSELQSRYADYKLSVPEPGMGLNEPPRVEGGAHKKPKYIPKNIKGAISPGAALGSGAIAAALGLSASPEAQAAMQRASSAIQDLGVSPDIFAGKGEELGRLGSTYVTAGNPSYRAELLTEMKKTKDPERYQLLLREYEKAKGNVPGGRGIAPPSAYMR